MVRIFQVFSVAIARSLSARIGHGLVDVLLLLRQRRLLGLAFERGPDGAANTLVALIGEGHDVLATVDRAGLHLLANKGYLGGEVDLLFIPSQGRNLPATYRDANQVHAAIRARGEQGFATLKNWKILTCVRAYPQPVGPITQAILTLENEG